jgi:hypothetical protein
MQHTLGDFTISRVAGTDPGGALVWLERHRAWDDRLVELERGRGALDDDRRESGMPVWVAVRDRAGT